MIDTGVRSKHWSRQQMVDFFRAQAAQRFHARVLSPGPVPLAGGVCGRYRCRGTRHTFSETCEAILERLRMCVRAVLLSCVSGTCVAQAATAGAGKPWMDRTLSADKRADLLLEKLTLEQKVQLLHGTGDPHEGPPDPKGADGNGGSGYVPGFPEFDLPGIQLNDSAVGVAYSGQNGRYSTLLPAAVGLAATWDVETAEQYGRLIGRELRDQGYNMSLAGGVNLTREPRDARTFEYEGEDPLLAGTMVGHLISWSAVDACDRRHQALCGERPGGWAACGLVGDWRARDAGDGPAGV